MSQKVFERLMKMMIETAHEERVEIDEEIERRTGKYCDDGVDDLSDSEFVEIINKVKRRKKKRRKAEEDEETEIKEEKTEEEVEVVA